MAGKKEIKGKADADLNGSHASSSKKSLDLNKLPHDKALVDKTVEFFEDCVNEVFNSRRDFFVSALNEKLQALEGSISSSASPDQDLSAWIEIESLSRLRAVVGGRFQNIKSRWVEAGFPLREHRGDRKDGFKVDSDGWLALSNWVSTQGFETRLTPSKTHCLFEIRQVGGSKNKKDQNT